MSRMTPKQLARRMRKGDRFELGERWHYEFPSAIERTKVIALVVGAAVSAALLGLVVLVFG